VGMKSMSISKSDTKETNEKDDKRKNRNVVAKSNHDKKDDNKLYSYIKISSQFLKDCKMELKRVKWPTRKELLASTAMVLFLVILIALFLGLFDELLIVIFKMIAL
jgi:preprotein translocase subunit SecE